jgi:ribonuclease P protein component
MNPTPGPARDGIGRKAEAVSSAAKTASDAIGGQPRRARSLKGARLRKHADYQRVYSQARKRQSASMSWFMASQPADQAAAARVGLTAGKVLGRAHERNRIKRRMREAIRSHIELLPAGFDLIFHPRRAVLTLEFAKLEAEIVRILEQARAEAARLSGKPAEARPGLRQ